MRFTAISKILNKSQMLIIPSLSMHDNIQVHALQPLPPGDSTFAVIYYYYYYYYYYYTSLTSNLNDQDIPFSMRRHL
jgi:hypothetical protein